MSFFKIIVDRLDRNVAAKDDDEDGFSDIGTLRGYWWKGIDLERILNCSLIGWRCPPIRVFNLKPILR